MVTLGSLGDVTQDAWATTAVSDILSREHPTLRATQHLNDALAAMRAAGAERAAVLEGEAITGMLSLADVIRIETVLEEIDDEARGAEGETD
jgi:signal-transduction protein with cAMP-binding, CBS, and nucleotidyltransferase domain